MISKRVHNEREVWFRSDFYAILYVIYYVILMSAFFIKADWSYFTVKKHLI